MKLLNSINNLLSSTGMIVTMLIISAFNAGTHLETGEYGRACLDVFFTIFWAVEIVKRCKRKESYTNNK